MVVISSSAGCSPLNCAALSSSACEMLTGIVKFDVLCNICCFTNKWCHSQLIIVTFSVLIVKLWCSVFCEKKLNTGYTRYIPTPNATYERHHCRKGPDISRDLCGDIPDISRAHKTYSDGSLISGPSYIPFTFLRIFEKTSKDYKNLSQFVNSLQLTRLSTEKQLWESNQAQMIHK